MVTEARELSRYSTGIQIRTSEGSNPSRYKPFVGISVLAALGLALHILNQPYTSSEPRFDGKPNLFHRVLENEVFGTVTSRIGVKAKEYPSQKAPPMPNYLWRELGSKVAWEEEIHQDNSATWLEHFLSLSQLDPQSEIWIVQTTTLDGKVLKYYLPKKIGMQSHIRTSESKS